jgi:membrane protein DedA with SNARE-associated domain
MVSPSTTSSARDRPPTSGQRRETRRWLLVLGVLGAGSALGTSFSLYLVNHYPLLLVALSPLGRHILLAAPVTDPAALLVVAVLRRMLFYLATFQLGRALGPAGIRWIEARAAYFGRFVRWVERLFSRASHAVVLVMAGPTVSALAGISGMRVGTFLALATIGLVVRLMLVIVAADWLREPLERILAVIDEYWVPGTVVLASGVGLAQWRRFRAARKQRRAGPQ